MTPVAASIPEPAPPVFCCTTITTMGAVDAIRAVECVRGSRWHIHRPPAQGRQHKLGVADVIRVFHRHGGGLVGAGVLHMQSDCRVAGKKPPSAKSWLLRGQATVGEQGKPSEYTKLLSTTAIGLGGGPAARLSTIIEPLKSPGNPAWAELGNQGDNGPKTGDVMGWAASVPLAL